MDNTAHTVTPVPVAQVKCLDPELEKVLLDNAKRNKENRRNFADFEVGLLINSTCRFN